MMCAWTEHLNLNGQSIYNVFCFCMHARIQLTQRVHAGWQFSLSIIIASSQRTEMKLLVLLSVVALAAAAAKFEFLEEWETWKEQHGKGYQSEREELERHLIWLSTKKYIDQHNANSDIFGFTLAINHFADLVSEESNVALAIAALPPGESMLLWSQLIMILWQFHRLSNSSRLSLSIFTRLAYCVVICGLSHITLYSSRGP